MRAQYGIMFLALMVLSTPVLAGNLTFADGQTSWQSTQCTEPPAPATVVASKRKARAVDMNELVTKYNEYVKQMQGYMDCVSHEAETDSNSNNQAITNSAKGMIDAAQKKLSSVGAPLQAKM